MNWKTISKNETIIWLILLVFSLYCTCKMAFFCLSGGILNPDCSLYLISALKYAGIDYWNLARPEELFYTPIISFLTSLIFRLGLVDKAAIIIVTSILCFLSYIGVFFLLKIRFNSLLSLTGVVIYGSTSVIIFNLSKGLIDIPAISISIWALYFGILAIDKNPKYFLISFPLLVIGFFTKYISGFILPLLFLYYLMDRDFIISLDNLISDRQLFKENMMNYIHSKEFLYIIISIIISLILAYIICKTLILDFGGSLTFFVQTVNTLNINNFDSTGNLFNMDKSYYIDEFSKILFEKNAFRPLLTGLLYGIFGISIVVTIVNFIKYNSQIKDPKKLFKTKHFEKILGVMFCLSVFGMFYGFTVLLNNIFSNICFLASIIILHSLLKRHVDNDTCLKLTLVYFSFFIVYLIFLSLYPIKLPRYAIPLIVPFVCIIVWSLDTILNLLTNGFKELTCNINNSYSKKSNYLLIIILIIFLVSTLTFIAPMEYERSNNVYQEVLYKGYSNDLVDACDHILANDSNYHSKTFASFPNSSRTIMWYLKTNVTIIDEKEPNLVDYDNSTYLILYKDLDLNNYNKIKKCGDFNIYYHK